MDNIEKADLEMQITTAKLQQQQNKAFWIRHNLLLERMAIALNTPLNKEVLINFRIRGIYSNARAIFVAIAVENGYCISDIAKAMGKRYDYIRFIYRRFKEQYKTPGYEIQKQYHEIKNLTNGSN